MTDQSTETLAAECSILGLGAMGAALAKRLQATGVRVAVWNRTQSKGAALVSAGATAAATPADAFHAASITLVVLSDTRTAIDILGGTDADLSGRTLVNFCSGAPDDAEGLRRLVQNRRGRYVGGAITAYPRNVGHPQTCFVYSGNAEAYEMHKDLLARLSGDTLFLSESDASALGAALTIQAFVAMGAFYEAVAAGTELGSEAPLLARNLRKTAHFLLLDAIDDAAERIEHDNFEGSQATIETHLVHVAGVIALLQSQGIKSPLLEAFRALMQTAQAQGYGREDIAATAKALAPLRRAVG